MTRRVLVARLDSVGDVLLTGPAIRAIAATAEVALLCGPTGVPAGRLLPGVTDVQVDLHPGELSLATVSATRDIPTHELSEAVAEAGYTVVSEDA